MKLFWPQLVPKSSKMSFFRFSVFNGGDGCIRSHPGAFTVVSLQKAYRFQPNRSLFYQIRGFFYVKINLILKVKLVIGFTENVKIIGRNNAIHHFDTCGLSIFLQIHFLHDILLY